MLISRIKDGKPAPHLSESIFSLCACCCHLKTLLDTLAACPYISIVMSFCNRTKNTITCSFCWAKMFMHLIMTRWSKLSLLTSIYYQDNERGDCRLCFCFIVLLLFFLLSFFHFRIVRPKIRERILLQLFMYMR